MTQAFRTRRNILAEIVYLINETIVFFYAAEFYTVLGSWDSF